MALREHRINRLFVKVKLVYQDKNSNFSEKFKTHIIEIRCKKDREMETSISRSFNVDIRKPQCRSSHSKHEDSRQYHMDLPLRHKRH